jgi:hypothetical protein
MKSSAFGLPSVATALAATPTQSRPLADDWTRERA